jgi:predicted HTH domain antitoxin
MQTRQVDVPEEILDLLHGSHLGERSAADQVKIALAIHVFLEGLISVGKAAELAEVPRLQFEALLVELGVPTVRYELVDFEQDLQGIAEAERRSRAS